MLALAFGCLGALAVAIPQGGARMPPELPVVRLDGVPGILGVLSGTPQHPAPLPSLPVTRLDERGRDAQLDEPRGLSLTFARPLPVRDVLLLLFRGTPFSIAVDPGVSARFVGELKDVTLRQALESVLVPAGLDYDADGAVVHVFPRRSQTRFFSVDRLDAPRQGMDFFAEIDRGVQAILSATGKYHVNRKAALVQVTDFADRVDLVASYLETVHLRVSRQVRVHARIFEVIRADGSPIDWSGLAARPRSGVRKALEGDAAWRVEDFDAWFRTLAEVGSVRHIAAPVLLVMNNEPAILTAKDAASQSELTLTVTPQIAADRIIQMHVVPSYIGGAGVVSAPGAAADQFSARVDTVLRVADGDTVVMGGFLRRQDAGLHAELVVLLTATTVTPGTAVGHQPSAIGSGRD